MIDTHPLLPTLELLVPLRMMEMRHWHAADLALHAQDLAEVIASNGDSLMFRTPNTTEALNATVTGIAAAALTVPGGVTFAGLHWCRDHRECTRGAA